MKFWENVKILIKERNTTQEAVAIECGISFATFRGWVSKGILPKVDQAVSIAKVLNTSVEFLISGIDSDSKEQTKLRRNFHEWVDSMDEEELESIVDLFEVFDGIGKKLGK
ncbi:MAG: helix-turn-helix transcriptional regulator [Spirochaetales bacterium]|nr:helix-turn-helix transcriptional regulator [Spirochaetales bacterium]